MAQQTAVEWLEKELKDRYHLMNSEPFFEQAKQMMKEQIMEAHMKAKLENIDTLGLNVVKNKIINDTEQYYKETYGKK